MQGKTQFALDVVLADLARAGVRDIVSDSSFSFYDDTLIKIGQRQATPAAPTANIIAAPAARPVVVPASQIKPVIIPAGQSADLTHLDQKPKKAVPFESEDFVWIHGSEQSDVTIIVGTSSDKGESPLTGEELGLFTKMMGAIDIEADSLRCIVIKENNNRGKPFSESHKGKLKKHIEQVIGEQTFNQLLIVGQEACHVLLGGNLSVLRKQDLSVDDKQTFVVCHPKLLLKQPALKRMAWQDLLKLKQVLEG